MTEKVEIVQVRSGGCGFSKGRYRDTRAWRSPVGAILSMGMEYHVIHHLFPRIPLFQTGPAYHEMRRMLDERGCRNDRPD